MREFGKKSGSTESLTEDASPIQPVPGKSTLTSALPPMGQRARGGLEPGSGERAADAEGAFAGMESAEDERPDEDWKPGTGTKTTTLNGTYGKYVVEHGLTKAPDPTDTNGWGDYFLKITMTPNSKTGSSRIAFVQVVRRGELSGVWHTKSTDPFMSPERVNRTDAKSGFKVDRYDATKAKTPFYGMQKGPTGVSETTNTHAGKFGGDKPWLKDVPGVGPNPENAEFVATATDMADGTQFDAVKWGFKYEAASKTYAEVTPVLMKAGSAEIAGRDRAIKKWNDDVATAGSDIDKVPVKDNPTSIASTLNTALGGVGVDESAVTSTLAAITNADLRRRVAASYEMETGRKLADDLKTKLPPNALNALTEWIK